MKKLPRLTLFRSLWCVQKSSKLSTTSCNWSLADCKAFLWASSWATMALDSSGVLKVQNSPKRYILTKIQEGSKCLKSWNPHQSQAKPFRSKVQCLCTGHPGSSVGNLGGQRIHDLPGARSGLVFEVSLIEVNYIKEGGLSGCTNLFLVGFLLFSFQFPFLFIFKSFPFLLLFLCLLLLFFSLGQFLVSFLLSLLPLTFLSSFALLTLRLFLLFLCILLLKNKMWYVPVKKNITHHNISRFLWYPNPWNPNQNCFQTLHLRFYWNCFVLTSFAWIFSWVGWNRSLHHALPSWKKATCNPLLFHFPNPRQERGRDP